MRVNYQRSQIGMLGTVFALMAITLYMAFAFPYSLLHFKQSETTQLKAVIVVGRHGEMSPGREAYFESLGEEPPEEWFSLGGPNQLTALGKERLYLMGKFLRLQYYDRLVQGNPRKVFVRSENSDKCLESSQALLAGLLPPNVNKNQWLWSTSGTEDALVKLWQPKAVHTTDEREDDLLSSTTNCLEMDNLRASWKNSTRYSHLLNEFRHDLQMLRQNTGLALEDDLEILAQLEEQLRARSAFSFSLSSLGSASSSSSSSAKMPSWYTSTFASRLGHIADVTAGARFSRSSSQRLFVGRLLDTIVGNIFARIRSDLTSGVSLLSSGDLGDGVVPVAEPEALATTAGQLNGTLDRKRRRASDEADEKRDLTAASSKLLPPEEQIKLKLAHRTEPNMFVYMTDKQHLTALQNSLGIYTSQPHYGAQLVIELHYDPVNQIHFLRLFSINSLSHNVLPEPVRVQPIACLDSVECSPQQFERNLRHLMLDKQAWAQACLTGGVEDPPAPGSTTTTASSGESLPVEEATTTTTPASGTQKPSLEFVVGPTERSDKQAGTTTTQGPGSPESLILTSTAAPPSETSPQPPSSIEKLDESLLVGPTNTRPISSGQTASEANGATEKPSESPIAATTILSTLTEIRTTTQRPEISTSTGPSSLSQTPEASTTVETATTTASPTEAPTTTTTNATQAASTEAQTAGPTAGGKLTETSDNPGDATAETTQAPTSEESIATDRHLGRQELAESGRLPGDVGIVSVTSRETKADDDDGESSDDRKM